MTAVSLCYVGEKARAFAYCYSLFKISRTTLLLASCPGEPQIGCRLGYSLYSLQSSALQNGVSRLLLQETKNLVIFRILLSREIMVRLPPECFPFVAKHYLPIVE